MTKDETRLAALLDALRALRDNAIPFTEYVALTAPQYASVPPHLRPLYELIQRTRSEQIFATVSMPPRHGKTTTFELAVAWRVELDPACLNFYVTFADDRATNFGRNVRKRILQRGIPLDAAAGTVGDWRTFAGGGLKSTSKGGQIMGEGSKGGLILIDDILKGASEARSKSERDKTFEFITSDVMSRIEGGASVILLNTRWDDDDPIGRILREPMGLKWIHVNLPAVGDENGHPVDERIYAERARPLWLDVDEMNPGSAEAAMKWYSLARSRGEHNWWAMYQGVPRSDGLKVFSDSPERFALPFDWRKRPGMKASIVMDPAATAKTSADYTAMAALVMEGVGDDARMYVLEAVKKQITVPQAARLALEWQRRYGFKLVVEAVGAFKAIPQMIREISPGIDIHEIRPLGDKLTRAQPCAAAWNTGRVLLPIAQDADGRQLTGLDWVPDMIRVVSSFTGVGDREDDLVDVIAHGWNAMWRPAQRESSYRAEF